MKFDAVYKTILDNMNDPLYLCNLEKNIIYLNPAAEQLTGWTLQDALKKKCYEIFGDEQQLCKEACPIKKIVSQKNCSLWHKGTLRTRFGELKCFQASISPIYENDRLTAAVMVLHEVALAGDLEQSENSAMIALENEIIERKKAEEALWKSEERYRALSDATFEAIFISENGICIETNQMATDLFGYEYDELIGIFGTDVIAAESKKLVKHNMLSGYELPYEAIAQRKDGSTFHAEIRGKMMEYKGRNVRVTVVHNIDERKKAEEHIHSLTQQLMKTQENERQEISRELHDSVAQDLSTAKIYCDLLMNNPGELNGPEIKQRISDISGALHNSINAVRNLAYYLHPAYLDDMGIVEAVSQYCKDFSSNNELKINFRAIGMENLKLDFDTEINLYRLIQEGLNNIKKHADANQATIRLLAAFPCIILRIEDDGRGFDVKGRLTAAQQEKRMGLRSMEERVSLLGGKMKIQSRIMGGTKIFIEVPGNSDNVPRTN